MKKCVTKNVAAAAATAVEITAVYGFYFCFSAGAAKIKNSLA